MDKIYKLNDKVIMKKLKCVNCGREIMIDRLEFERKLKKVMGGNNEEAKS